MNNTSVKILIPVSAKCIPVILFANQVIKEAGKPVAPNCSLICHCHSVKGQYPHPNHMPKINQQNEVIVTEMKCTLLVAGNIHPDKLNSIITICRRENKTSIKYSIA